jgi:hypothetical protein
MAMVGKAKIQTKEANKNKLKSMKIEKEKINPIKRVSR